VNSPPLVIGAALAFWGWQSGNLFIGALLGLALEALRAFRIRIDLGVKEHSTIADLSTVGFVLLAVLLAANRGIGRGILEAFTWQPVALSPVIAAQLVSADRRIPLSALFRHMRRLKRARPELKDPPVDVSAIYVALALLAAGVANRRGPEYYIAIVVFAGCLLLAARPRGASVFTGAILLSAAAALGYAGHLGLSHTQLLLTDWVLDLNIRSMDADPYRTRTEIGSLGRLKKYDAIVLRVYAEEKDAARVQLLHRGSYNTYVGGIWVARAAPMEDLESESDNETWILEHDAPPAGLPPFRVRISSQFDAGRALLALPAGTTRIASFPATQMRRNLLGAAHAQLGVDWATYEAQAVPGVAFYAPPTAEDSVVPFEERIVLERIVSELGLRELAPAQRLKRIEEHLGSFSYSTFRERAVPARETALGDFLTRSRAGHCEYFATAATLLARAAGVPARYATGFAAFERSRLEDAYIVRTRHAHAWTRAWLDGRWLDVDTTPAGWGAEEESEAPVWQGLADLFRFAGFRWSQRGEFKAGEGWYAALAALALFLAWRVLRGRRILREEKGSIALRRRYPGEDSEFYAVEKLLPERGRSETHSAWVARVSPQLPDDRKARLAEALRLHQRYRFDPDGIAPAQRERLRALCRSLQAA
jgi:transglutaminase-like putative cysteine protease